MTQALTPSPSTPAIAFRKTRHGHDLMIDGINSGNFEEYERERRKWDGSNIKQRIDSAKEVETVNEIKAFEHPVFGNLRTIEIKGKVHFVGVDVTRALKYANPSKAVIDHCKGITKTGIPSYNQHGAEVLQETNVIPEGDIYRLIVKAADQSKSEDVKKVAEQFERWVFDEILPSIHATGSYTAPGIDPSRQRSEAMLLNAKARTANLWMKLGEMLPDSPQHKQVCAAYASEVLTGKKVIALPEVEKTYTATEVGEIYGVHANKVERIANEKGLKTKEYGMFVLDKSRHSSKEVETFRYNAQGLQEIGKYVGQ